MKATREACTSRPLVSSRSRSLQGGRAIRRLVPDRLDRGSRATRRSSNVAETVLALKISILLLKDVGLLKTGGKTQRDQTNPLPTRRRGCRAGGDGGPTPSCGRHVALSRLSAWNDRGQQHGAGRKHHGHDPKDKHLWRASTASRFSNDEACSLGHGRDASVIVASGTSGLTPGPAQSPHWWTFRKACWRISSTSTSKELRW